MTRGSWVVMSGRICELMGWDGAGRWFRGGMGVMGCASSGGGLIWIGWMSRSWVMLKGGLLKLMGR